MGLPEDRKPTIALYLPSLHIGGVERVMLNLARGLAEHGLRVDLVLAKAEGQYLGQVPASIRVVDLGASRVVRSLAPLVQYLRVTRPHGLISAKDYANVIAVWAVALARVQTRTVVTVHTTLSRHVQHANSFRDGRVVPILAHWAYKHAHRVVAVSRGVADDLSRFLRMPRHRITVIYNPVVDNDLFRWAHAQLSHSWFVPGEPPVITSVGRLTVAKDYRTLMLAFAKVRERRNGRLVILGDGEERIRLEGLVHDLGLWRDVWLPGFVDPPHPIVAHSSVFVLSSIWEGLSTAMIEALALGVPVVSTDCPGSPREILDDGRFGELVPVGDVDALANAILRALDSPHNRKMLIERAQQFTVGRAVEEYLATLGFRPPTSGC